MQPFRGSSYTALLSIFQFRIETFWKGLRLQLQRDPQLFYLPVRCLLCLETQTEASSPRICSPVSLRHAVPCCTSGTTASRRQELQSSPRLQSFEPSYTSLVQAEGISARHEYSTGLIVIFCLTAGSKSPAPAISKKRALTSPTSKKSRCHFH